MARAPLLATLSFEDYPGDEVVVRLAPVPLATVYEVIDLHDKVAERFLPDTLDALVEAFAPLIESWSFPEAVGVDGLRQRDPALLKSMVLGWYLGVRDVPGPLPLRSSGTGHSGSRGPSRRRSSGRNSTTDS